MTHFKLSLLNGIVAPLLRECPATRKESLQDFLDTEAAARCQKSFEKLLAIILGQKA